MKGSVLYHRPWIGDPCEDGFEETAENFRYSGELVAVWECAMFIGEYIYKSVEDGVSGAEKIESNGWYAQAGYLVIPEKLQLTAWYSWLDPNMNNSSEDGSDADVQHEYSAGFSYWIHSYNVFLQANYSYFLRQYPDYENPCDDVLYSRETAEEHLGIVQLQLKF